MKNNFSQDQTQFVNESPLYESSAVEKLEKQLPAQSLFSKLSKKQKILSVFGLGFIVTGVTVLAMMSSSKSIQNKISSPTQKTSKIELTNFEQRLTELKQELEAADPSQDDLPFPPVDMDLRLDPSK